MAVRTTTGRIKIHFIHLFSLLLIGCFLPSVIVAGISTDGTVGPAQSLRGPDFQIPHDLGSIAGQNLFHSFLSFSISKDESATFSGPDSIQNIISRVTGGEVSNIDGLLRSEVGQADFFFLNPAGVIFGPNARVDVPAAFHVSTADEIRFADGSTFAAADPEASTLSVAPPEAFGFLSPQEANITINGSSLEFKPESTVTFAGENVTVSQGGSVKAEGGLVRILGVGDEPNSLKIKDASADCAPSGEVDLESSTVDVSGTGGSESVMIRGGRIRIANSEIAADHSGSEDSKGSITLEGSEIEVQNGDVRSKVYSEGKGPDIIISAENLDINETVGQDRRSQVRTQVGDNASGWAGEIQVSVDQLRVRNGGRISSMPEKLADGGGGTISIEAFEEILIEGSNDTGYASGIYTTSHSNLGAQGGSIHINAPEADVTLKHGGILESGSAGNGNAGSITISADELLLVNESKILTDTQGSGAAGNIFVEANDIKLLNLSEILADTYESGSGGTVQIHSTHGILMDNSYVEAATIDSGSAGQITISGKELILNNGSLIAASCLGDGNGGEINLNFTDAMRVEKGSFVSAGVLVEGTGTAGRIEIISPQIELLNGGWIENASYGEENAGEIHIEGKNLVIDGMNDSELVTGILADTNLGSGNGGDIEILLDGSLILRNGGRIESNTYERGQAGKITISADELLIDGFRESIPQLCGIYSEAWYSAGDSGDIQLSILNRLALLNGGQISTGSQNSTGKAGNIKMEAGETLINGEKQAVTTGILSQARYSEDSGEIQVSSKEGLQLLNGGQISTSAAFESGSGGKIGVKAKQIKIDGENAPPIIIQGLELETQTGIFSETAGSLSGWTDGDAGDIKVEALNSLEILNRGKISTSSVGKAGNAGTMEIEAKQIRIDGGENAGDTGILSKTSGNPFGGLAGTGGDIKLKVTEGLDLKNAGQISSSSGLNGMDAGSIEVEAKQVSISGHESGIQSDSLAGSAGKAGRVKVTAGDFLRIEDGGSITTSSIDTDGGPITVKGKTVLLREGLITTSVEGRSGNGGDISIGGASSHKAEVMILDGGFIQANTAAEAAHGGDITIDIQAVIAESDQVEIGGIERQEFIPGSGRNIIQAAAPDGVQGAIAISAPELDISGSLVNLGTGFSNPARLATDPCRAAVFGETSALVQRGRGGLPEWPEEPSSLPFSGERLDRLLETEISESGENRANEF
ncbi:MAG: filamentous hemagglutinin N-terminal domain-containing protein [Thermodesulfobacteriota bacterium]